jgi:hypothetical protein
MRTKEEQRRIAKMGGIASGEARRRKKTLREALITLLNAENYEIDDDKKVDGYVATALALIKKAMNGDVPAITVLRDTVGEKPREELDISVQKKLEDFFDGNEDIDDTRDNQ